MFGKTEFGSAAGGARGAHGTADLGFSANAMRSGGLASNKSIEKGSVASGGRSGGVGFQLGRKTPEAAGGLVGDATMKSYHAPTLAMLNPELYKEMQKQEKQMKDPIFVSVRNLKERYGYHEMRVQRI